MMRSSCVRILPIDLSFSNEDGLLMDSIVHIYEV